MLCDVLDDEIRAEGIEVISYPFKTGIKGAIYVSDTIKSPVIGISKSVNTVAERNGVLSHELGHYWFGTREALAERYALTKAMPLCSLVRAYIDYKIRTIEDLSEFLEVTPDFLSHGFAVYIEIYGNTLPYNQYEITFSPFKIIRIGGVKP